MLRTYLVLCMNDLIIILNNKMLYSIAHHYFMLKRQLFAGTGGLHHAS